MKKSLIIALLCISATNSFAQTSDPAKTFVGGGIVDRQTGAVIRLACADEKCTEFNFVHFSSKADVDGKVLNQTPIQPKMNGYAQATVNANVAAHRDNFGDELIQVPYFGTSSGLALMSCIECSAGLAVLLLPVAVVVDTALLPVTIGNEIAEGFQTLRIRRAFKALTTKDKYVTLGDARFMLIVNMATDLQ